MAGDTNVLAVSSEQEKTFERGFKSSWCENTAESIRSRMGLTKTDPLSPYDLASYLEVKIINLADVPDLSQETIEHLSSVAGNEWSAVTVHCNGLVVVVVNPSHSGPRQASDLMHELAHIIRGHKPSQVHIQGDFAIRDFDQLQEAEADWLAGCLLLPRSALFNSAYKRESTDDAIQRFGVSKSLFTYRMNKTGVKRQLSRMF